jgi:hypothetical protein
MAAAAAATAAAAAAATAVAAAVTSASYGPAAIQVEYALLPGTTGKLEH